MYIYIHVYSVFELSYLHTLCVTDPEKEDKWRQSLPPGDEYYAHTMYDL